MVNVQRQMLQFHEAIKLKRFDENEVLREKRDRILTRLNKRLPKIFESKNIKPIAYEIFDQGSYPLGTGTNPPNGHYDIDTGIRFKISKDDYPNPVFLKECVYLALSGHTYRVEIRRSCVTVFYQQEGEPVYHVDLAIYSDNSCNPDGKMYLAKGKLNSTPEQRLWQESDPLGLMELIKNCFSNSRDAEQFRHTIRYLKRWKDIKFSSDGNAAPIGIGITVAAFYWFKPSFSLNSFANTQDYDDLEAVRRFVDAMLGQFKYVNSSGNRVERLVVQLPVSPSNDLFEKMTDTQMTELKEKLGNLLSAIEEAQQQVAPEEACKILQKQFGDDFPVPSREETAQKRSQAIISSSASA
jgi:hypothetical protein